MKTHKRCACYVVSRQAGRFRQTPFHASTDKQQSSVYSGLIIVLCLFATLCTVAIYITPKWITSGIQKASSLPIETPADIRTDKGNTQRKSFLIFQSQGDNSSFQEDIRDYGSPYKDNHVRTNYHDSSARSEGESDANLSLPFYGPDLSDQNANSRSQYVEHVQLDNATMANEPVGGSLADSKNDSNLSISGRVITDSGKRLKGVNVSAQRLPEDLNSGNMRTNNSPRVFEVLSRQDGWFTFKGLQNGRYRLSVAGSSRYAANNIEVKSGSEFVDIVVEEVINKRIAGSVVDSVGMPIEGVNITVNPLNKRANSNSAGSYSTTIAVSRDKQYQITFELDGYRKTYSTLLGLDLIAADGVFSLDAVLGYIDGTTTISGNLYDTSGNGVPGQRVQLISPDKNTRYSTRSNDYGEFIFHEVVASDDYRLGVTPDQQFETLIKRDLNIGVSPQHFELVLENIGEFAGIKGQVVDPQGKPVPDFNLTLIPKAASNNTTRVRSNEQGEFIANDIPAGPLVVRAKGQPNIMLVNASLLPGETKQLKVFVDWGDQSLSGTLVDSIGQPVAGASLTLSWVRRNGRLLNQTTRTARSDSLGGFNFSNLGGGLHSLSVASTEYASMTQQIDVGEHTQPLRLVVSKTM